METHKLAHMLQVRSLRNDLRTPACNVLVGESSTEDCWFIKSDPSHVVHQCRVFKLRHLRWAKAHLLRDRNRNV